MQSRQEGAEFVVRIVGFMPPLDFNADRRASATRITHLGAVADEADLRRPLDGLDKPSLA